MLQRRWDLEESKLRSELEKTLSKFERYADVLEARVGARFHPGEEGMSLNKETMHVALTLPAADSPPDNIEDLYDELEGAAAAGPILARLSVNEAGWLARFMREKVEKDRERAGEDIERELKVSVVLLVPTSSLVLRQAAARMPAPGSPRFQGAYRSRPAHAPTPGAPQRAADGLGRSGAVPLRRQQSRELRGGAEISREQPVCIHWQRV